CLLFYSGPWVF
nr:immunoglobulin light chain junction region [Macaca mulatta]MPN65813.1 immunoglobulin light chain junction region [Macaca mulatta]MPN65884.1 immunoglobulin light chain junction region [Macaca mulatta]MPN65961.1 immunoglobulin light chain junction region [Macaca mulatta]MPN65966.1 immunoglobulin light chain junction region [Macaca mulatta]